MNNHHQLSDFIWKIADHMLRIANVARERRLSRATVTLLYKETAQKVYLYANEKL